MLAATGSWAFYWDFKCNGCAGCVKGFKGQGKGNAQQAAGALAVQTRQSRKQMQNALFQTLDRFQGQIFQKGHGNGKGKGHGNGNGKGSGKWQQQVQKPYVKQWNNDKGNGGGKSKNNKGGGKNNKGGGKNQDWQKSKWW